MNWKDYIASDPNVLYGKPAIKGTRIAVDLILEKLSAGQSLEDLLQSYPHLNQEQIFACLAFAADSIRTEIVKEVAA